MVVWKLVVETAILLPVGGIVALVFSGGSTSEAVGAGRLCSIHTNDFDERHCGYSSSVKKGLCMGQ